MEIPNNTLIHDMTGDTLHSVSKALRTMTDHIERLRLSEEMYLADKATFNGLASNIDTIREAIEYEENRIPAPALPINQLIRPTHKETLHALNDATRFIGECTRYLCYGEPAQNKRMSSGLEDYIKHVNEAFEHVLKTTGKL